MNDGEGEAIFRGLHSPPPGLLQRQRALLKEARPVPLKGLSPFREGIQSGNPVMIQEGLQALSEGKVGCLLIAGGQGTRLRFHGPKGMFPIGPITNKTLFQVMAGKVKAASVLAGRELPFAVMTSPQNHEETLAYFSSQNNFGLGAEQISFFTQNSLPLLNDEGNWFLQSPGQVAVGPDGNGGALAAFVKSGIWRLWKDLGVQWVNWVLVDNPLADPFDLELLGNHVAGGNDVTAKVVKRQNPDEKVGVLVNSPEGVRVVEYTELSEKMRHDPAYDVANVSLFCFSMDFIEKVSAQNLPLHLAHKAVSFVDDRGEVVVAEKPNAWKFEKFIFDVLPYAQKVGAVIFPREECFAPLKNAEGADSPESVKAALEKRDRQILQRITECQAPDNRIELDPAFYYPTENLKKRWKGKVLREGGYIQP